MDTVCGNTVAIGCSGSVSNGKKNCGLPRLKTIKSSAAMPTMTAASTTATPPTTARVVMYATSVVNDGDPCGPSGVAPAVPVAPVAPVKAVAVVPAVDDDDKVFKLRAVLLLLIILWPVLLLLPATWFPVEPGPVLLLLGLLWLLLAVDERPVELELELVRAEPVELDEAVDRPAVDELDVRAGNALHV